MKSIFILLDYQEGHILPTIGFGDMLKRQGFKVFFLGIPDVGRRIVRYGFSFIPVFERLYPEGSLATTTQVTNAHLIEMIQDNEIGELIKQYEVGVIVNSYLLPREILLIHYKYGIQQIIFNPIVRRNSPYDEGFQALLDFKGPIAFEFNNYLRNQKGNESAGVGQLAEPLLHMPEFIACAKNILLPDKSYGKNVYFIGPCIRDEDNEDSQFDISRFEDKRVFFASLGSQSIEWPDETRLFCSLLIETMKSKELSDVTLILSTGVLQQDDLNTLPDNVLHFNWVPSIKVLSIAELAIFNAGLGTIKECIKNSVPMIVFPVARDQFDNADLVDYHKIGIKQTLHTTTPARLRDLIIHITTHRKEYLSRLQEKRAGFVSDDSSSEAMGLLRELTLTNGK